MPAADELVPGFTPENDLESALASDADIRRGWAYVVGGTGHPERDVGAHVAAILRNISPNDELRSPLRFIALVHDSMKWAVDRDRPWSPDNDHAVLARRAAERHTDDPTLLETIELHDDAYWIFTQKRSDAPALERLLDRLPDVELYVQFVELDATNEGKDPTFLLWLRNETGTRGLLPTGTPETRDPGGAGPTIFIVEWETEPDHQERFAAALASAMFAVPGADEWDQAEVLRSSDRGRVLMFGRAAMPPDVALLRGRTFARALAEQVDQTGVQMMEAHVLESVEPERRPG
jgi:hypothetical protein